MIEPSKLVFVAVAAAVLGAAVLAEWTILGVLLRRGGMPHGRLAIGAVFGLLVAVSVGLGLLAVKAVIG